MYPQKRKEKSRCNPGKALTPRWGADVYSSDRRIYPCNWHSRVGKAWSPRAMTWASVTGGLVHAGGGDYSPRRASKPTRADAHQVADWYCHEPSLVPLLADSARSAGWFVLAAWTCVRWRVFSGQTCARPSNHTCEKSCFRCTAILGPLPPLRCLRIPHAISSNWPWRQEIFSMAPMRCHRKKIW
jgi:hypothetical protein